MWLRWPLAYLCLVRRVRPGYMHYLEFRDRIRQGLHHRPDGWSWAELQKRLQLPYSRPCRTWIRRMESEIGLYRTRTSGREFIWKIPSSHISRGFRPHPLRDNG